MASVVEQAVRDLNYLFYCMKKMYSKLILARQTSLLYSSAKIKPSLLTSFSKGEGKKNISFID
jgi:hypothetical protein